MREWINGLWKPRPLPRRTENRVWKESFEHLERRIFLASDLSMIVAEEAPQLVLGGTAVTWIKKEPAVVVLPLVAVGDTASLAHGTLTISVDAVGSRKKVLDSFQIPPFNTLGSSPGPQFANGHLTLQIELSDGATPSAVQLFLKGIKFSTKGKGLKAETRTVNVTLEVGGLTSSISQSIHVHKKAPVVEPGTSDTIPFSELSDARGLNLPNAGYHALASAPDGTIARVIWQTPSWMGGEDDVEDALYFGELQADGTWIDESIPLDWGSRYLYGYEAQLFFDAASVPHVVLDGGYGLVHLWRTDVDWELEFVEYSLPGVESLYSDDGFTAALGPGGEMHVAFAANGSLLETDPIVYGTNASGEWTFEVAFQASALFGYGSPFQQTGTYARYFQLAVDSHNDAHIVFTPEFETTPVAGGSFVYSELAYASNRTGTWTTETIDRPADGTGDSGLAASIAIDPQTDRPAIASFFVDRVGTGSPTSGRLYYHVQQANGSWTHQTVATTADRYIARDGNQGTGFAPLLIFDGAGRANILFSDYASQHFAGFGADEFAGQLRHARLDGSAWHIQTVFRQADPIRNYLIHPAFAMSGNRVKYLAIWRRDVLGQQFEVIDHHVKLLELTLPLFT